MSQYLSTLQYLQFVVDVKASVVVAVPTAGLKFVAAGVVRLVVWGVVSLPVGWSRSVGLVG